MGRLLILAILFPAPLTYYDSENERTILVGTEIFNANCKGHSVYTKVENYLDWINAVVDTKETLCREIKVAQRNQGNN